MRKKLLGILLCVLLGGIACELRGESYVGRVVDERGEGIGFATVYLSAIPEIGTATNNDGWFELTCHVHETSEVIVSFIGYEKAVVTIGDLASRDSMTIVLKEQPIALQEMVVEGKSSKKKNRRKEMSRLLYEVYNRMEYDFSDDNTRYKIVSDVRMDAEGSPWGMEQMIAEVVVMPARRSDGRDSLQFSGKHCKRFFDKSIRARANDIYESGELAEKELRAASEVDSGVVVHKALWGMGNIKYDFRKFMSDVKHWTVTTENDGETVLTHREKHNYLGLFKFEIKRHYILDSETYSVKRFSEEGEASVSIPFGYKVKGVYLDILNLLNMDQDRIEKFRIRRGNGKVSLNTIYERGEDGKIYVKEKNLVADVKITSTKKQDIPLNVKATQRATWRKTGVEPMKSGEITRRVKREVVEVY